MIEGKWLKPGDDLSLVLPIRGKVLNASQDALDDTAWNAIIYYHGTPSAAGRIWWADGAFWLGSICVPQALRGKGLGDLTLRLLLFKAQQHGAQMVKLTAPPDVVPFFERYGFTVAAKGSGEAHWLMVLPAKDICLDRCSHCSHNQSS